MSVIAESILNQFRSSLKMTKEAVENVADSRWHDGFGKWFFSQTVYQILEAIDFYSRSNHEGMEWGKRANYVWDAVRDVEKEILPKITKELVMNYISEIEDNLVTLLANISDDELLKKDGFDWFSSILEKLQYALRHTAHHCGELAMVLRIWNSPHIKWT